MQEPIQTETTFYESGIVYKLLGGPARNSGSQSARVTSANESYFLEPVFDLRRAIKSSNFGPPKTGDQLVILEQGNDVTRLYFQYSTDAIEFFDFALAPKDTESIANSMAEFKVQIEVERIYGWSENFGRGNFTEDNMDSMIDLSFKEYFYLEIDSQTESLEKQFGRWRHGLKWYNEVEINDDRPANE